MCIKKRREEKTHSNQLLIKNHSTTFCPEYSFVVGLVVLLFSRSIRVVKSRLHSNYFFYLENIHTNKVKISRH